MHARHLTFILLALAALTGAGFAFSYRQAAANETQPTENETPPVETHQVTPPPHVLGAVVAASDAAVPDTALLGFPMENARERVTKKTFGLEIEPGHSPVPNDRFSGFHVGVDFETFENEQEIDIPVLAICDGPLLFKAQARGYGGVAVQRCALDGKDVSVIYGHLRLASVTSASGTPLQKGRQLGLLGTGHSEETDGVRKHLHLGIREGTSSDIRGYVQEPEEIGKWLDPLAYMAP